MDSDAIVTAANTAESLPNTSAGKPERNSYQVRKAIEGLIHLIFLLCGIVAVAFVLLISIYLIVSGLPAIREIGLMKFLLGRVWDPTNTTTGAQYGILAFILSSVYGTAGAIVVGVPVGLMTAVFLAKVAPPKLAAVIRAAAGGHSLRGIRPCGHDRSGACHSEYLFSQLRRLPAGGHHCAGHYDPALHHQRVGNGTPGCTQGI